MTAAILAPLNGQAAPQDTGIANASPAGASAPQPAPPGHGEPLWTRLGEHLPWVKTQQVSTHWIRHTILTWVERRFGFAVAQAYAGHQDDDPRPPRAMSATGTYVRAGLPEVALALSVLTGEPHPLAPEGPSAGNNKTSNQ